jgi:hypothetical protein
VADIRPESKKYPVKEESMRKQFLYTSFALLLGFSAAAQNKTAIKYSRSISKENAYKHLSVLASDEYEGRETGKKGAWMAADYIKKYFKGLGLKGPVKGDYFQPVDVVKYELSQSIFTVNGASKELLKDFLIPASSVGPKGFTLTANEVIFAGYGISKEGYNDYQGLNVAGKVVMIFLSGDPTNKPGSGPVDRATQQKNRMLTLTKLKYLTDQKALAVICIDPTLDNITEDRKAFYSAGQTVLNNEETIERMKTQQGLNSINISSATADEIFKAGGTTLANVQKGILDSLKPVSKVLKITISASAMKKQTSLRAENVLGYLEGSDPNLKKEVLVITGHYDHLGLTTSGTDKVYNGADDDGSGTTGVLLIADAFVKAKKAGHGPKRSILFMTVVGEEKGLWGSEWYSEHPVFPLENTIVNLNTDMIGRTGFEYVGKPDSANYIYVVGSEKLSSDLKKISEQTNATYTKMKLDYKYDDPSDTERIYYRSDHYNFAKHNIPIIFYFDGLNPQYHQASDEIGLINFPLLAKRAKLTYFTAWTLANRPLRPAVDKTP